MTDKKALKIIKRYIELKTRVEERGFPITPYEFDLYEASCDKLKKIKKEYKEAEKQLKKSLEVLEIIRRTQFQIYKLGLPNNYKLYFDTYYSIPITEEEANLIRKVLPIKEKQE